MAALTGNRILLIRHGQTAWSVDGRHTGRTDVDLTDLGEHAARRLQGVTQALRLTDPVVICSPRVRAVRTAELAGLRVDETTELVAEWDYGDYEGLTSMYIHSDIDPHWTIWTHGAPGGESLDQMTSRVDAAIDHVTHLLVRRDVVVVAHGHFSRAFIARFLGQPIGFGAHVALAAAGTALLSDAQPARQLVTLT